MKNLKRNYPPGAARFALLLASLAGACGGRTNIDSGRLSGGLVPVTGVGDAAGQPDAATDSGRPPPPPVQSASTQVDLLFDIDNSSSMYDKQSFLMRSMPNLVGRLIQPDCVRKGGGLYPSTLSATGPSCSAGDSLEFSPVNDLHLAILSSSLGARGGDICDPTSVIYGPRADDRAHLLGAGTTGLPATLGDMATPGNFFAWHPAWAAGTATASPVESDATTLLTDFGDLIADVGENGCGIESQLESWYRFLIQPDPYLEIQIGEQSKIASWSDSVDATILAERAAFLRPTSIVGVIVLTDENDSEIDVRAYGGLGYSYMASDGNGILCKLPQVCTTNPNDPSCVFEQSGGACANGAYTAADSWGLNANLRHVHMKEKYGLDPQYPISRYVNGLSAARVPDRNAEYPQGATSYDGTSPNCLNPLFAAAVYQPTSSIVSYATTHAALCTPPQPKGGPTRTPDMVFYAVIGGVPYQDLHYPPAGTNGELDWSSYHLSDTDWTWMVGRDPEAHDFTGIDPHMIEDYRPRQDASFGMSAGAASFPPAADVAGGAHATLSPTSATRASGWDPINGREWITDGLDGGTPIHQANGLPVDRQYACIFPLPDARDCTIPSVAAGGCDCQATKLSHDQTPPVCNETRPTTQDYGRAYPTTRELLVARDLARVPGSNPGIVASICPVKPDAGSTDPLFGYNPAMSQLLAGIAKKLPLH